jgi:hypothetical protein
MTGFVNQLNLRPFERRLLVGVAVVLFVVLNLWLVWPHFSDWRKTQERLESARLTQGKYNKAIAQKEEYRKRVGELEAEGEVVSQEDQANQFLRMVQNQAAVSGVSITSISRQTTRTNEFFLELLQTFTVQAGEEQLVDFLYELGSGDSIIRARGLSLRPNGPRQLLGGNIDLVASYQKNPAAKKPTPLRPATPPTATPTVKKK